MTNYAIHNGSTILNIIVADSQEIAENISKEQAFEITSFLNIGWIQVDGTWVPPKPYDSWVLNNGTWEAPVPKPDLDKDYEWQEYSQTWLLKTESE